MQSDKLRWLWLLLLWWGLSQTALAQREEQVWYFGRYAGVSFATGWPVALTDGALLSREACTIISNEAGFVQFYSNGVTAWNSTHKPLIDGTDLGDLSIWNEVNSSTQGALIVPHPGNPAQYFLFGVDGMESGLVNGMRVALIEMQPRNVQGKVLSKRVRLPTPTLTSPVTEKLAAVRHANGRDTWVLVHGWETNAFMAFLVSPAGVSASPVTISYTGSVHEGAMLENAIGCMTFSPNGQRLAVVQYHGVTELFDFDTQTGRVSNPRTLPASRGNRSYGVAFSPNSNLLYGSGSDLVQYNLLTGAKQLIDSVAITDYSAGYAIKLGPDGRLYRAWPSRNALDVISFPDVPGPACGFIRNAVPFTAPAEVVWGLPNTVVVPRNNPGQPALGFQFTPACAGSSSQFAAGMPSVPAGTTFTWNFGDPAADPAYQASGATVAHAFATPGAYTVSLQATWPGAAAPVFVQQRLVIAGPPAPAFRRVQMLCDSVLELKPTTPLPDDVTFRWQDGEESATRIISTPGTYWVELTSAQGCTRRDTIDVYSFRPDLLALPPDTVVCLDEPVVLQVRGGQPGLTYQWPDGSTGPRFVVNEPGSYTVQVLGPAGCQTTQLTQRVTLAPNCENNIPNVITPNGDGLNETWVLKGLRATEWQVVIYSRWGQRVYARDQYDNSWRAEGLPAGVYYYHLTSTRNPGRNLRGWVEVVK